MAQHVGLLPEQLQLKILSLVGEGRSADAGARAEASGDGVRADDAPPAAAPIATTDLGDMGSVMAGLSARLHTHGYTWQDDFLPRPTIDRMLESARAQTLAPAGMSSSLARWHDPTARGDSTAWLPLHSPPIAELGTALHQLVDRLNADAAAAGAPERLQVPAKAMLARYPPGAHYVRHSDVSPAVARRRVTAIVYLNPEWRDEHAGHLVLHGVSSSGGDVVIAPHGGRLVLFRSHIEHAVAATSRERCAHRTCVSHSAAIDRATCDCRLTRRALLPQVGPHRVAHNRRASRAASIITTSRSRGGSERHAGGLIGRDDAADDLCVRAELPRPRGAAYDRRHV